MMYNYIIFDIDGTILDTEFAVLSSLQKLVSEELNKKYSFEELRFALGIPGEVTLSKLGITNLLNQMRNGIDILKNILIK